MGLSNAFVGFSSTDIDDYRLMQAWRANNNIDLDFNDCQLNDALASENEEFIKTKCRERINMADKYVMLIGKDTKSKHKYVQWEAEVAIEKGCTIICVNLDGSREMVRSTCPPVIRDMGAIFVAFSPRIVAHAIENYKMHDDYGNYYFKDEIYKKLGH
ncbi:MAG: TIR domain-containing protein [Colwellia sp.]|uniref:TIR domain-containing protein n=1 Tax=Colwellia sp. TaxID=56799 RepID=UPI0025BD1F94|nr:TIR domain-containing protein [Colwellia sp.]NQZ26124.1 TIR domain-containing protein [Colwellia sp.]